MKFQCQTLFDITCTGVTGHFKSSRIPFKDRTGRNITDEQLWNFSRNQQRNWETILQLISMRTQLFEISDPKKQKNMWIFEFESETPGVFGENFESLYSDSDGIPMLSNLLNDSELDTVLRPGKNIWFTEIPINKL